MKGKEQEDRAEWERTRWLAFENMLLSPFIKDYQRPKNVLQYYRFPWEKESPKDHKRVELTEENVSELYRIIGKLHKQTS